MPPDPANPDPAQPAPQADPAAPTDEPTETPTQQIERLTDEVMALRAVLMPLVPEGVDLDHELQQNVLVNRSGEYVYNGDLGAVAPEPAETPEAEPQPEPEPQPAPTVRQRMTAAPAPRARVASRPAVNTAPAGPPDPKTATPEQISEYYQKHVVTDGDWGKLQPLESF